MTSAFTPDAARALGGPDWLVERRLAAVERLADITWPSAAEEIWRYSRIGDFDVERYRPVTLAEIGEAGDERAPGGGPWAAEVGKVSGMVVVRDGRVVHHEVDAELEAKGVRVCELATCGRDDEVSAHLGSATSETEDAFTVLHDAFLPGGALISVPRGVVVPDPIVVLHWSEGEGEASFPHTLVVAGENSEVTVLERTGSPQANHLVVGAVELFIGDAANVRYLSVQEHGARTWSLSTQRAHIGADASLRSAAIALGGQYARLRSESVLSGRGGESDLLAAYFGDEKQMLDFRTLQDHAAPNTQSNLLFKGAVEDDARSVYSGLIRIREEAAKAEAYQTNRNLVLTEGAGAESIPNLEILNNDVRCSHASTVGSIDPDQMYYLESRGVPPEEAERLIVLGFFDDVLDRLPLSALTGSLRGAIVEKIEHPPGSGMSELVRLCGVKDVEADAAKRVDVAGLRVAVVHIGDDWYAIADRCSHADESLSEGDVWPDERELECPKHGSTFSLLTGEPQTLPATRGVPVYDVRVEGDDVMLVVPGADQ